MKLGHVSSKLDRLPTGIDGVEAIGSAVEIPDAETLTARYATKVVADAVEKLVPDDAIERALLRVKIKQERDRQELARAVAAVDAAEARQRQEGLPDK